MAKRLSVDVWSDIACPWCYVGKRRLETALREFPFGDQVDVTWHAFELDPAAPPVRDRSVSHAERIAKKYGMSVERAKASSERLRGIAREEGLEYDFENIKSGNTFHAHRLVQLAKTRGLQEAMEERLMHAYLCEGAAIGETETLLKLGVDVGLDADEVQSLLSSDMHAREVRADEARAHALGIHGVPFFVIGGRYGVEGAQPAEVLVQALTRAWDELPEPLEKLGADGAVCGPDGCDDVDGARSDV